MNYTFVLVVILTGEIRFLSLLGLTGRRLDPVTHSKISATWTRNLVAGCFVGESVEAAVERDGINENNNNNGFSFLVASPLEVRANFHNFTARLRSFARSLDKIASYAG